MLKILESNADSALSAVTGVVHHSELKDVFDLTVPNGHNYISNGVVSHNTLMALYICLQLGQKVIMLANQHEFLTQFIDHIQGNEKEEIPKCTNLPELQKKYGKKLFGYPKTDEDYETMQFFCMTYNQFITEKNGKDRLRKIIPHVGTLFVDECFTYAHRLRTEKGFISIGDLVEGRESAKFVLSHNEKAGIDEMQTIQSATSKASAKLCRISIDGNIFTCTPNHQFYVRNVGYVEARNLKVGDDIVNAIP